MKRIPAVIALTAALSFGVSAHAQTSFADVPAGHWAQEAIARAVDCGIILGYPDGTFRGKQAITRYEAAAMIGRLLEAIKEGKCGLPGSGAPVEMDTAAMEALQNAVQELSADLADQGVRISELEDNAVSQDDLSRVEELATEARDLAEAAAGVEPGAAGVSEEDFAALQDQVTSIEELAQEARDLAEANTPGEPTGDGTDPEAMLALIDQVEAAGIAADTALAQSRDLQDSVDALNGRVDDLESQLGELGATVEGQADSIAALNDLVVLLNEDVLSLQDRVSALEGQIEDVNAQFEDINAQLESTASADDLEALREFTTLLRRDQTALADRVSDLEARVGATEKKNADQDARLDVLEANGFTISGSISLGYYVSRTWFDAGGGAAPDFDIDRLGLSTGFSSGKIDGTNAQDFADFGQSKYPTGRSLPSGIAVKDTAGGVKGGNQEGRVDPQFNITFGLKPRNLITDPGGFPGGQITLGLTLADTGFGFNNNSTGDISSKIKVTGLQAKFTVGGAPLTFSYGSKPEFKFSNLVFNSGGWGDGYVATADASSILPGLSPKLTVVYASNIGGDNFDAAVKVYDTTLGFIPNADVTALTVTNGPNSIRIDYTNKVRGKLIVTFTDGSTRSFDSKDETTDADGHTWQFALPGSSGTGDYNSNVGTVATISFAKANGGGNGLNAREGNNLYAEGVKGSLSLIPGLTGGVYYGQKGKDIAGGLTAPDTYLGLNFDGKAFGFLNLDGEYAISTSAGAVGKVATYVKGSLDLGVFTIGGNYRLLDKDFATLDKDGDFPFAKNASGFGVDGSVNKLFGFLSLTGYFDSRTKLNGTNLPDGPKQPTRGAPNLATSATNFGFGATIRLIGFDIGGNFDSISEVGNDWAETLLGFSAKHDGSQDDALIKGLDLALGYASDSITAGKFRDFDDTDGIINAKLNGTVLYGYAGLNLNLGGLTIKPAGYFSSSTSTSTATPSQATDSANGTSFGGIINVGLPFLFGSKVDLAAAIDSTNHGETTKFTSGTTWLKAGLSFDSFLLPNSSFSVAYAFRSDTNRNGRKFGPSFASPIGLNYDGTNSWGSDAAPSATSVRGGVEQGLYFTFGYSGLNFAYGIFSINPADTATAIPATPLTWGQAFSISYKLKF
jgi:S-layer homology domain